MLKYVMKTFMKIYFMKMCLIFYFYTKKVYPENDRFFAEIFS
jgi:hypothetical protein